MNEHVARLIKTYKQDGLNGLIANPELPDDMHHIRAAYSELSGKEKEEVDDILNQLMAQADQEIKELEDELKQRQNEIIKAQESADACLAYVNSERSKLPPKERGSSEEQKPENNAADKNKDAGTD